jgi:hypothetical protein
MIRKKRIACFRIIGHPGLSKRDADRNDPVALLRGAPLRHDRKRLKQI